MTTDTQDTAVDPRQLPLPLATGNITMHEKFVLDWFLQDYPATLSYNQCILSLLQGNKVNGHPECVVSGAVDDLDIEWVVLQMNAMCVALANTYTTEQALDAVSYARGYADGIYTTRNDCTDAVEVS